MNTNKHTLVIDIDGTICPIKSEGETYESLVPNFDFINQIKKYHSQGWSIVFFTSRNMRTYSGNIGLINVHTLPTLLEWLNKWEIPYNEVICGKPWPGDQGFYVDDKAIRPKEFVELNLEQIQNLINKDRVV